MMNEHTDELYDAQQARAEALADWLRDKGIKGDKDVTDEDSNFIAYLVHKTIPVGLPILSVHDLVSMAFCTFFAGYRKGYEVRQLEQMSEVP